MQRIIFFILLSLAITPSVVLAQYKVSFSNNYPPYNYLNEEGELVGFNVDIINAIIDIYKSDINISGAKWNTINEALEKGEIHAIGGTHYPGSPDNDYIYSRSTINTSHCFVYNTNHYSKFSLETFRTSKEPLVVMWKNDVLKHYVLSLNPLAKFIYVRNYDELISYIDDNAVTCIFGQRIGSMYYAKKYGKDYIQPLEHRILERPMGFKISPDAPELAKMINNGLEVILANGEYNRIYDKWITEHNRTYNGWQKYLKYLLISGILILVVFLFLLIVNRILQNKIRNKTKDLQHQLGLNSQIMVELEEQKIRAEESDKMKSAFLANMSHEIRTPMNGILGFTDLLKSADFSSEKQAQFIEIIQRSGNRMLGTINNIIDVSKLEAGMEKAQITEVDIRYIMSELLEFFSTEASSKSIKLSLKEEGSTFQKPFYTDEYKLNSILTNLIKNSIKFTRDGSIEIKYSIHESFAEFWVSDTGIGIAKDKQAAIFDQFVQADFSHSSGFEGSGLGLAISQGYINILKGEIKLESEQDKGTTFNVRIPNDSDNKMELVKRIQTPIINESKVVKYKILIAEDDETSFFYLKHAVQDIAESIIHAENGLIAVEMAKKHMDIDIILMDIKMPKLNGLEATEEIRKFNKDVYIIAQTAYAEDSYDAKVKKAGCNSYISKPVDKQKLIEMINQS